MGSFCFDIFLGKKKISHQKQIHIKKNKFIKKKHLFCFSTNFLFFLSKFFDPSKNWSSFFVGKFFFLFGNFFRSKKKLKKNSYQKQNSDQKNIFLLFYNFFFLSKIFLIQEKIEARFLNFLSKVLCFPLLEYFFL